MAGTDSKALFLQVDASIELLRRHLAEGDAPMARFEGRAEQMARKVEASIGDMGKRFGAFASLADDAATKAQKSFESSFSQIQKLAATAIKGPTVSGGINLGIDDLRGGAAAAQQRAKAYDLITAAAKRAAAAEGDTTQATHLFVQAGNAARIEAEREAASLLAEAAALERVQIELRGSAEATELFVTSHQRMAAAAEAEREVARSAALAAAAERELASEAAVVRAALDPMFAAQQRFDAELVRAERLLAGAAISEREYAQEVQRARDALYAHAQAVTGNLPKSRELIEAQSRLTGVSGTARIGMQQLGYQLNDVATQYASGAKASIIFAQQSGQVIQALQLMGGGTNAFLRLLGGPWGIAFSTALVVLSPFVGKLFEHNDALKDAVGKLKKDADETELTRRAHLLFTQTIEGEIEAQRRLNEELDRQILTQRQIQQLELRKAQKNLAGEQANQPIAAAGITAQEAVVADYQRRVASLASDPHSFGAVAARDQLGKAQAQLVKLRQELTALNASVIRNGVAVREAEQPLLQADVAASLDRRAAAALRYEKAVGLLNQRQALGAGKLGFIQLQQSDGTFQRTQVQGIGNAEYQRRLTQITRERDVAYKAADAAKAEANRKVPLGTQVRNEQAAGILSSAESYRGLSETRDNATLQSLFSQAGVNVDPKMTAWCAAFVNAVLATNNLPGTASLSARSFLNYGTATNTPTRGDIVVSRRGTGGEGHVGFYEGTDAHGNVQVLGGNTGNRVGVQRVARGDVLGFRRAPSASAAATSEDAARRRALAEDSSYTDEERQARRRLLDATRRTAASEEERDGILREEINAEADAQKRKIANQYAAGAFGVVGTQQAELERDHLNDLNERARAQKLQNVTIERATSTIAAQYDSAAQGRDTQIATLRLQLDMATTADQRRRIAEQLLSLEQEQVREALKKTRDTSQDPAEVQRAIDALKALPPQEQAQRDQQGEQNLDPLAEYRKRLHANTDDMKTALQGVKVDGLQTLEDGLLGLVDGTETVAGAFKKMAQSIIADLARIAIEKAIVSVIGKSFFGFSSGGEVQAHADGGAITGRGSGTSDSILSWLSNGEFVITAAAARRIGMPALHAINRGSGLPGFASGGPVGGDMGRLVPFRGPNLSAYAIGGRSVVDHRVTVGVEPSPLFATAVRQESYRVAGETAEPIMAGAQARTMRGLSRPSMPTGGTG